MSLPKVIDLFSGCGGSALGFEQLGFDIKVAVDIDKSASETFRVNFPSAIVLNVDINQVKGKRLLSLCDSEDGSDVVIIACPPCQGFSSARRKSQSASDVRNELIYEFLRIVKEVKPIAFVMENVPGLSRGIGKPMFDDVLKKLKNAGYNTVFDVVNAADYGVPQRRRRLVLIGVKEKNTTPLFPQPTHSRNPEKDGSKVNPWNTVRNAIFNLPKLKAGEKSLKDPMHICSNISELNLRRMKSTPINGGGRESWPEELILVCHKKIKGYTDIYGRMRWDTPSPAITAGCTMISKGRYGHPEQDRAISIREAARLQSFPDDFVFLGNVSQIASQIGNAVPVLLARKIGESFIKTLELLENRKVPLQRSEMLPATM